MLEQAEHSRAQERTREFDLSQTPATIEEIHNDFKDYLDYLKDHAEKGGTYGLKALLSIHQWVIAQEEGEQRADAWETLIRALDDSRTAYHIYPNKFVEGKDYSCSQGYEERLLDAISPIRELIEDALQLPPSESFIPDLASPYITENIDGTRRASDFLYGAYCLAAGYRIEETTRQKWTLSAKEIAPAYQESLALWKKTNAQDILLKQSLKQRYRSTLGAQEFHEEAFEAWKKAPSAASADGKTHEELFWTEHFKSYLAILCTEERDLTEQEQSWKIAALVEPNTIQELSLIAAEIEISDEQALKSLIEYAGFINEAHRDFVLAILQEGVEELKIRASLEEVVPPRFQPELPEEMSRKMDDWALVQGYWSFPAISEESEEALLTHIQEIDEDSAPPCSESALIALLSKRSDELIELELKDLLFSCIAAGYSKSIEILFNLEEWDPNTEDTAGNQVFISAAKQGHAQTVQLLINIGANIDAQNPDGHTALMLAAENRWVETVQVLINAGACLEIHNEERYTALMFAAENGDSEIVGALLLAGANIDAKTTDNTTALMLAIDSGCIKTVQTLLTRGAYINTQTNDGETALMLAAEKGCPVMVEALINAKAALNLQDHDGRTALTFAADNSHTGIVRMLITAGYKINFQGEYGAKLLLSSSKRGDIDMTLTFIDCGVEISNYSIMQCLYLYSTTLPDRGLSLSSLKEIEDFRQALLMARKDFETNILSDMEYGNPALLEKYPKYAIEKMTPIFLLFSTQEHKQNITRHDKSYLSNRTAKTNSSEFKSSSTLDRKLPK